MDTRTTDWREICRDLADQRRLPWRFHARRSGGTLAR